MTRLHLSQTPWRITVQTWRRHCLKTRGMKNVQDHFKSKVALRHILDNEQNSIDRRVGKMAFQTREACLTTKAHTSESASLLWEWLGPWQMWHGKQEPRMGVERGALWMMWHERSAGTHRKRTLRLLSLGKVKGLRIRLSFRWSFGNYSGIYQVLGIVPGPRFSRKKIKNKKPYCFIELECD